ncbi:MAG: hypothetical protein SGARI_003978, partial [Bacillariaceae sp.]
EPKRGWWIKEEDELLLEKYEEGYRWKMIADFIPNCTPQEARERYELLAPPSSSDDEDSNGFEDEVDEELQKMSLPSPEQRQLLAKKSADAAAKKPNWTLAEDKLLIEAVIDQGKSYGQTSSLFSSPVRSGSACWNRLNSLRDKDPRVERFFNRNRVERDDNDDEVVRQQNASNTETKNAKEREDANRSTENKSPDFGCNLELWSPKEKLILQKAVKEKVLTFREISEKYFEEAHTERSCELQWRELNGLDIDENAVVRAWTPNEDGSLIEMFKKGNSWTQIASVIPCCTREDVSRRYKTELEDWKESEKQIILQKRKECGKDWTKIASVLPGRTLYEVRYFCRVHEKKAAGPPS